LRTIYENIQIRKINQPIYITAKETSRIGINSVLKKITKMKTNIKNNFKKFMIATLAVALIVVNNPVALAIAYDIPSAPTPPIAPEVTIDDINSAPTPPLTPENNYDAPIAPSAPTLTEMLAPSPTPEAQDETFSNYNNEEEENNGEALNETSTSEENNQDSSGENLNGQVGDVTIDTGEATNSVNILTEGNDNLLASPSNSGGGVSIVNDGNGTDSTNSGSIIIGDNNNTFQGNTAYVVNDANQETVTGNNSASENVGNSEITTGDANTTGTVVTAVNTNVDGVGVAEFNIADDHMGDIILDFSGACFSSCLSGDTEIVNTGNGSDSTNSGNVDSTINNNTFQDNDAVIENNVLLSSDSGNNTADNNTGGNSEIRAGDANVSAGILNFANNNLAGNVVYAVVNIFGNLVGDIILPDGSFLTCCVTDATLANSGNGSNSTNTANLDSTTNDETYQFNNVELENNLVLDASTGGNSVSANTGGDSSVTTGEIDIAAQVMNIANLNLVGGNYWLVLVNEAGKWIGKILGAPDGSNVYGSEAFEITVDENGEIVVLNSGNGSGSNNSGTVTQNTNNTIVQSNDAKIVNNVDLSANTGGNSASRNTGGGSTITTGDANIVANIVNFVNNNIVGSGKLFVTVINVFGSWLGDFVAPGQTKEAEATNDSGIGGALDNQANNPNSQLNANSQNSTTQSNTGDTSQIVANGSSVSSSPISKLAGVLASASLSAANGDNSVGLDSGGVNAGKKVIKINLAWLFTVIPALAIVVARKKRFLLKTAIKKNGLS